MTSRASAPMSPAAVTVEGLTKRYGDRAAVDDLTFELPRGVVAGFIGPNGAGKTTTMAMLLGLVTPTAGHGSVLGHPLDKPASFLPRVGALIEGPAMYPGLTGTENLRVLAAMGNRDASRIPHVLEQVGLEHRGRRPLPGVLDGHEAAARDRRRPPRRSRAADPRRADQRPRPRRHARDPRPHLRHRVERAHRARVVAPAQRDRAGLRLADRHRARHRGLRRASRRVRRRRRIDHRRRARASRPTSSSSVACCWPRATMPTSRTGVCSSPSTATIPATSRRASTASPTNTGSCWPNWNSAEPTCRTATSPSSKEASDDPLHPCRARQADPPALRRHRAGGNDAVRHRHDRRRRAARRAGRRATG